MDPRPFPAALPVPAESMNYTEYVEQLVSGYSAPQPGPVLEASEALSVHYLRHLMVMHKYIQEYRADNAPKKVEILMISRSLDAFVTAARLLRMRYYNSAMNELRMVYDVMNLMRWLLLSPDSFHVFLSSDSARVLREFTPTRVRANLGRTRYDTIYSFLASYATHPFYTGKEFLLGLDVASEPQAIVDHELREYEPLDAVTASVLLMTYAYATYELGTNFERTPLVEQDRGVLLAMYREIGAFLSACEARMGTHRSIHNVVADFREQFPQLIAEERPKPAPSAPPGALQSDVNIVPRSAF